MRKALLLLSFSGLFSVINGKFDFYNDYTQPVQWNEDFSGEDYKKIEELANYLRKRAEEAEAASLKVNGDGQDSEPENEGNVDRESPPFVKSYPNSKPQYTKDPDFAVGPSDPRFYQDFVNFGKVAQPDKPENINSYKKKESDSSNTVLPKWAPEDSTEGNVDEKPESLQHVYEYPVSKLIEIEDNSDIYFAAIVSGCSAAAVLLVVIIGMACYRLPPIMERINTLTKKPGKKGTGAENYTESIKVLDKTYIASSGENQRNNGTAHEPLEMLYPECAAVRQSRADFHRLQKNAKAAAEVDYPAYGVTGPHKDASPTSGDRRLAQSAQMYHYQHQKQQIIAMESRASNDRPGSISDAESDEENEEGDYTVYECPGLASTGEMEVKNPLFQDDQTPATPNKTASQASYKKPQEPPK